MHVVVLVAAERGRRCLESIVERMPAEGRLTVFTFPEHPVEPPFVDSIKQVAASANARCYVTTAVESAEYGDLWASEPDLVLVIGWRYMLPDQVMNASRNGCFIFHDSYLPRYRGFSPTVWAIRNGEAHAGATLFRAVAEMDAGPIVERRRVAIGEHDHIADVMERVTQAYLDLLANNFEALIKGEARTFDQDHLDATYTCRIGPEDFRIRWSDSAESIFNLIRSYSAPYPGAFTSLDGRKITILKAAPDRDRDYVGGIPGRFLRRVGDRGLSVAAGTGQLLISEIAIDDGPPISALELPFRLTATFESP